jgi:hypothetical protein
MAAYSNWLCESANKFNIEVNGWVFMTNHVHLLLTSHALCLGLDTNDVERQSSYQVLGSE